MDPSAEKYVICYRFDGLGGRLINLISSWRIARTLGARTLAYWPAPRANYMSFPGADCRVAGLIDLSKFYMSNEARDLLFIDGEPEKCPESPTILGDRELKIAAKKGIDVNSIFQRSKVVISNEYTHLRLETENSADVRRELPSLFHSLPIHPAIEDELSILEKKIPLRKALAVHYRRGDIIHNLRRTCKQLSSKVVEKVKLEKWTKFWFKKCAPLESYLKYVDRELEVGCPVIVFSDDAEAFKLFEENFGDRYPVFSARTWSSNLSNIQFDFMEMIMMSRCSRILSTQSGFSQIPALLGGIKVINAQDFATVDDFARDFVSASGCLEIANFPIEKVIEVYTSVADNTFRRSSNANVFTRSELSEALLSQFSKLPSS